MSKEKDEKKESSVYKYGESELNLSKYIENLDYNVSDYLNKAKKDWTDE
jgi:hypothetical protein